MCSQAGALESFPGVRATLDYEIAGEWLSVHRAQEAAAEVEGKGALCNALVHISRCIAVNPRKGKHWWRKHDVHVKLGDIQSAIAAVVEMAECAPTTQALASRRLDEIRSGGGGGGVGGVGSESGVEVG